LALALTNDLVLITTQQTLKLAEGNNREVGMMSVKTRHNQTQDTTQSQSLSPTSHNSERWKGNNHKFKTEQLELSFKE
jgi:hypothetical protein